MDWKVLKLAKSVRQRVALIVLIAIAIGLGIYAELNRQEATRQAALVNAPRLAAQALILNEQSPWLVYRNALLALDAYSRAPTLETGAILRQIAQSLPVLPKTISHEKKIHTVTFDQQGHLLSGGADGIVRAWDLDNARTLFSLPHDRPVHDIVVSPDGAWIATREYNPRNITVWNAITGEPHVVVKHKHSIRDLLFSPSGSYLVTYHYQHPATVWSVESGEMVFQTTPEVGISSATFGRGDDLLATRGRDSFIRVWEIETGKELFQKQHDAVKVAISADGMLVASGDRHGFIQLWSIDNSNVYPNRRVNGTLKLLTFTPDNRLVAAGSGSNSVHISVVNNNELPTIIKVGAFREIHFSADVKLVITLDSKGNLQIWDVDTARKLAMIPHEDDVTDIAFDRSGRLLATIHPSGLVRVWDLDPTTALSHAGPIDDIAYSPDGRQLISASKDGTTALWDIKQSRQLQRFDHGNRVRSVTFSPDGKWFAAGDAGGMARVWTTDSSEEYVRLAHVGGIVMFGVNALAASPDSKVLASGGSDGRARLWAIDYGLPREALEKKGTILAVAFSPDGKRLATGDESKARLWDVDSLNQVIEYPHKHGASDIEFDSSGNVLATAGADGLVRLSVGLEDVEDLKIDLEIALNKT